MDRRITWLLAAALLLSTPAAAEIYRWKDDSGKEHFTTNLQAVPPAFRPGARGSATQQKAKPVVVEDDHPLRRTRNRYAAPKNPPRHLHGSQKVPTREVEMGSAECARAQQSARTRQSRVESAERDVERYEDLANDTARSDRSRARYERRQESAEARVEQLEDQLSEYVQSQRRAGIPFGCLR